MSAIRNSTAALMVIVIGYSGLARETHAQGDNRAGSPETRKKDIPANTSIAAIRFKEGVYLDVYPSSPGDDFAKASPFYYTPAVVLGLPSGKPFDPETGVTTFDIVFKDPPRMGWIKVRGIFSLIITKMMALIISVFLHYARPLTRCGSKYSGGKSPWCSVASSRGHSRKIFV